MIIAIAFFAFTGSDISAQRVSLGIIGAANNYVGDLSTGIEVETADKILGGWFTYHYNPYWSMRVGFYTGSMGGADSLSSFQWRKDRNLSFKTTFNELAVTWQLHFFDYVPGHRLHKHHTPYIFGGFSLLGFNPTAEFEGETVELRPLGTEGQARGEGEGLKPYNRSVLTLPFGIGYKVNPFGMHAFAFELGARYAMTDYWDDVSGTYVENDQLAIRNGELAASLADRSPELGLPAHVGGKLRGNSEFNDWLFYAGFTYIFTFKSSNCPSFDQLQ